MVTAYTVDFNSLFYQHHIHTDTTVIDFFAHMVFIPNPIRHRKTGQLCLDAHLRLHVTEIVRLELLPFFHIVLWAISCATTVYLGRCAGNTEVFD